MAPAPEPMTPKTARMASFRSPYNQRLASVFNQMNLSVVEV